MQRLTPHRAWLIACLIAGLTLATTTLTAAPTQAHELNLRIVDEQIIPGYEAFSTAAAGYAKVVQRSCKPKQMDGARVAKLQQAWHALVDSWMRVEHWRFGPVEVDLRRHRLWFWPDKHGRSGKQMRRLLSAADTEKLVADRFAGTSAAMQAMNAAERLIFASDNPATLRQSDYPCAYLIAGAGNFQRMATEIIDEWQQQESGERALIASSRDGNEVYANPRAVTTLFAKALNTQLIAIKDLKLGRPMGKSLEQARPKRGESWRSKRGLRNLRLNLEALQTLYGKPGGHGLRVLVAAANNGEAINRELDEAFTRALERLPVEGSLGSWLTDADKRARIESLKAAITTLRDLAQSQVPNALGVQLGFNSLDGD